MFTSIGADMYVLRCLKEKKINHLNLTKLNLFNHLNLIISYAFYHDKIKK